MVLFSHWFCTLLLLLFVQCNAAEEPICKVFWESGYTKYVVYTKLQPDEYDCLYSWNNCTDFVLANAQGHVDLVQRHTNTTLVMFKRMDVIYALNCMSGSTRETRHRTTCFGSLRSSGSSGRHSASITIPVIIAMSVLFAYF